MRITLKRGLIGLAGLLVLGALYAWSGLFNVAASSGHWAITNWALHWVMGNSVELRARFVEPPQVNLDDPALVRQAAGHYEQSCAFCHGSPLRPERRLPSRMTPPVPKLDRAAEIWSDEALFWIVKHGIKYTAMRRGSLRRATTRSGRWSPSSRHCPAWSRSATRRSPSATSRRSRPTCRWRAAWRPR
ncbi:c-type cytochrome [Methylobrevis pamukkalensis]|uniref:Cytochrome c domain-containing protein n=1 Tax=Methylobrevis pamukkalensis TaxID=1439726 RepID=A0A1E3H501_9HYPH|nr:cytochrome c [Methylobrevis pamukkalensis]ODN71417.1 hypothetical protein A6302_01281 [Methylobrevis pamukkalensis]